jgi:sulfur carrier protein
MFIVVNGETTPLPTPRTLAALLVLLAPTIPFAVAHNGEFIPRNAYETCLLSPDDLIDIVYPTAGG